MVQVPIDFFCTEPRPQSFLNQVIQVPEQNHKKDHLGLIHGPQWMNPNDVDDPLRHHEVDFCAID